MTDAIVIGTNSATRADFALNEEAVTQTFGILAMRGAGKSNLGAVMAESMFRGGLPFVVIDPVGAWWGLRSSADGGSGLPIPIFGGRHGDVPLERASGELVADLVIDKRLSCIVDVSEFESEAAKKAFLLAFAQRIYQKNEQPLHLFLEEADDYIPQRAMKDELKLLRAWENIVRRGRARGLGMTLITQRSAALNKNVLTQIETLFVLRTTAPQDRKAIAAWVEHHGQKHELLASLASLDTGEAWCWSPHWLGTMARIRVRRRSTFDSGATPKAKAAPAATLADVDLPELQKQWEAIIERAWADDPRTLRARIAELERGDAYQRLKELAALRARIAELVAERDQLTDLLQATREYAETAHEHARHVLDVLDAIHKDAQKQGSGGNGNGTKPKTFFLNEQQELPPRPQLWRHAEAQAAGIGKGAMRVLTAVGQHGGVTRPQLTVLTGFKRSTRDSYIQRLKQAGYLRSEGDRIVLAEAGSDLIASSFVPLPTGKALREHWLQTLPEGESAILAVLIGAYPGYVHRESLSNTTHYKRSTRDSYLQRLGARELIERGANGVRAAATLFS